MTEDEIRAGLESLEQQYGVKILYACESGSRAWGFPSPDSDYDIRFIYVHPMEWYLSVFPGKDTIDIPISGDSDMGGWDLRKCFALLSRSNCALIEWLGSPIIYQQDADAIAPLKSLIEPGYLPVGACHHYLSMASKKLETILSSDNIKLKSYFYALRATLCARYIVDTLSAPPMEIAKLIPNYLPKELHTNYHRLLHEKSLNTEAHFAERQPWLDSFLQESIGYIESNAPSSQSKTDAKVFDDAFLASLKTAWRI